MAKHKISTETHLMSCKLTAQEYEERTRELVDSMGNLEAHAERESDIKAQLKAERARIEGQIGSLSVVVRQRAEMRQVPVEIYADFHAGKAYILRQDTYEETSRPLTETERSKAQLSMTAAAEMARREDEGRYDPTNPPAPKPEDEDDEDGPINERMATSDSFDGVIVINDRLRVVEDLQKIRQVWAALDRPHLQTRVRQALDRVLEDLTTLDACDKRPRDTAEQREMVRVEVQKLVKRQRAPLSTGCRAVAERILAELGST